MEKTQEKPRLTKQERAFVEAINDNFWIARQVDDSLFMFFSEVEKSYLGCYWYSIIGSVVELKEEMFPFITYDDEKAWSKADLLALEVEE